MDGCTPTPEDDWKAERDRLQTQMGFDTDSELVPCHLMDGGKREMEKGGGVKERERGRREKGLGSFWSEYTCIMIKEKPREKRSGRATEELCALQTFFFSAGAEVKLNFTKRLVPKDFLFLIFEGTNVRRSCMIVVPQTLKGAVVGTVKQTICYSDLTLTLKRL